MDETTPSPSTCRHCGRRIVRVNYALGARWMHQEEGRSFNDGAYEWCRLTIADPPNPEVLTGQVPVSGNRYP